MIKFYEFGEKEWVFVMDAFSLQKYSKEKYKNKLDVIQKFFNDYPKENIISNFSTGEIYERKIKQEIKDMTENIEKIILEVTRDEYELYSINYEPISFTYKNNYKNRGEFLKTLFEKNKDLKFISWPDGKKLYRREQFIKTELKRTPLFELGRSGVYKPKNIPVPPIKSPVNYIISDKKVLTVYLNSEAISVSPSHINYNKIVEAVKNNKTDEIVKLFNVKETIEKNLNEIPNNHGKISILNEEVCYNGKPIHNYLTEQIIALSKEGLPWERLGKFLERLINNPFKSVFDELYRFLSNRNMPITEDGCFIGWKKVTDKYKDFQTGTVDNTPGKCPEMPKFEVDDNRRLDCSTGLHVGCREYVHNFYSGKGKIVLVKVAPEDVVCVPENEPIKVRVWKYEVLRDMTENEFLENYYV